MSFNWLDYLRLAQEMIQRKDDFNSEEAVFRAAISRAYYAAFCASRNFLRERGDLHPLGTAEDHERIKSHLQLSSDEDKKRIGNWLERLRDNRNKADYDDLMTDGERLAAYSLQQAEKVFNTLNKIK